MKLNSLITNLSFKFQASQYYDTVLVHLNLCNKYSLVFLRIIVHSISSLVAASKLLNVSWLLRKNQEQDCRTSAKTPLESAENRGKSVTDSGYAYVTQ